MLIVALSGWPDAAEGATRAVQEIIRQLPATKFASLDAEEFFDFSRQRPIVSTAPDGNRRIAWQQNSFYYWRAADHGHAGSRDILIHTGAEPQTKWRTYAEAVVQLALECRAELLLVVGALLAQTPHTRPTKVAGSASRLNLGPGLEHIRFHPPNYEGPSSMTSVLMEALGKRGIPQVSLWGHCPHYVQVAYNPAVSHALLREMQSLLPKKLNLARLGREAEEFSVGLARALDGQKDLAAYVKRLEEEYDAETRRSQPSTDQPAEQADPAALVRDLEEFLRQQRKQSPGDSGEAKA